MVVAFSSRLGAKLVLLHFSLLELIGAHPRPGELAWPRYLIVVPGTSRKVRNPW